MVAKQRFAIRNKRAARLKATLLVSLDNADTLIEDGRREGGMTTNEKPQGSRQKAAGGIGPRGLALP